MKKVVIFIVLLFLGIFGAKLYYEYRQEKLTEEAEKNYKDYKKSREAAGDFLSEDKFMASLAAQDNLKIVIEDAALKKYISPEGYTFSLKNLTGSLDFFEEFDEDVEEESRFKEQIGHFGPKKIESWPLYMKEVIVRPSKRKIASRVLLNMREWKDKLMDLNLAFLSASKVQNGEEFSGVMLGLHIIREKPEEERKAFYKKFRNLLRARDTLGRLQFHYGDQRSAFNAVEDMSRIAELFALEAVTNEEMGHSVQYDAVVFNYLEFLAYEGGLDKNRVLQLQERLMSVDLSKPVFNSVKVARIANTKELEKRLTRLTKREVDTLNIFDSGYMLTDMEKWRILQAFVKGGTMLCYDGPKSTELRRKFTPEVLEEFGRFANAEKTKLNLNKEANQIFVETMNKVEYPIHRVLTKQVIRDIAVVQLAISLFHDRTQGRYPESLDELTDEDIYQMPRNPLTGKPYKYEHVFYSKKELEVDRFLRNYFPQVPFELGAEYVIN